MPAKNGKKPDTQKTKTGLEIPIPKTKDFNRLLKRAATKRPKPKS